MAYALALYMSVVLPWSGETWHGRVELTTFPNHEQCVASLLYFRYRDPVGVYQCDHE